MCAIDIDRPALRHWFDVSKIDYSARSFIVPVGAVGEVPTDADFEAFLSETQSRSQRLTKRLVNGDVTPREWADLVKELLNDGHASAWVIGRRRAGDLSAATEADELVGIGYADGQSDFLLSFMEDVENGRYTDENGDLVLSKIQNRLDLYVLNMRGTSGASFVASSDDDEEFTWTLGGAELHCPDCPELAELSPWTQSELYAFPGDGNTKCLSNCLCHLERSSDGRTSFKPVSFANAKTTS